jgi:hypothetical protein
MIVVLLIVLVGRLIVVVTHWDELGEACVQDWREETKYFGPAR